LQRSPRTACSTGSRHLIADLAFLVVANVLPGVRCRGSGVSVVVAGFSRLPPDRTGDTAREEFLAHQAYVHAEFLAAEEWMAGAFAGSFEHLERATC